MTADNVSTPHLIESEEKEDLVSVAARSFKWSILYNVAPRLITPFSTMILAALLTPADFGLVAISTFVIALATILSEFGMGRAVIQRQADIDEFASVGMWLNLLLSLGIYIILWIAAPWISDLYKSYRVTNIIRVAALSLPLMAVTTIPKGLLRRNMQFKRLFWANSSFLIVQATASVILAFLGAGPWAIIWGQLIGMLISSLVVWGTVQWRPKLILKHSIVYPLLGFSLWVLLTNFQNWLILYADNAIAGIYMGLYSLGVYSLGFNIATLIPTFFIASLSDVAYPAFCKLQSDNTRIGIKLISLQRLTGVILFPIAFGIAAIASPTVELLYGNTWRGLSTVISILVIMPGLSALWYLNDSAYTSLGKPAIYTKLSTFSLLTLLPLLWFSAPYGLLIFTIARSIGALILPFGSIIIGTRTLNISISSQIKPLISPFLCALIMFVLIYFLAIQLSPLHGFTGWVKLFSIIVFGVLIYILMIRFISKDIWDDMLRSMKRILA